MPWLSLQTKFILMEKSCSKYMASQVIWKYAVSLGEFSLDLPKGAMVLSVRTLGKKPYIWAMVNPEAEKEERKFFIVVTGENFEWYTTIRVIGSYQVKTQVWHLFERS